MCSDIHPMGSCRALAMFPSYKDVIRRIWPGSDNWPMGFVADCTRGLSLGRFYRVDHIYFYCDGSSLDISIAMSPS